MTGGDEIRLELGKVKGLSIKSRRSEEEVEKEENNYK